MQKSHSGESGLMLKYVPSYVEELVADESDEDDE
jgi:hypothetical protein